jgi:hypothetical protein
MNSKRGYDVALPSLHQLYLSSYTRSRQGVYDFEIHIVIFEFGNHDRQLR